MKKTIIAIALVIVIVCVVFTACKSKTDEEATTTTTVPESTTIEVFTDPDSGEMYVTNKDGEHIPITTGLEGEMDFVEDLVSKTAAQVSQEAEAISQARETLTNAPATSAPADTTAAQTPTTTEASGGVEIGDGGDIFDEDHAAVIDWG